MPGDDGRDIAENRLTLAEVSQGISELPGDQQVLIALVCVEGLSYKEAAEVLQVPIGTVMSRLARARRILFEKAQPDRKTPPSLALESRRGRTDR